MVLRAALMQLGRRQRTVLVLRYFEDLSEQQVADALGISVGTVKSTRTGHWPISGMSSPSSSQRTEVSHGDHTVRGPPARRPARDGRGDQAQPAAGRSGGAGGGSARRRHVGAAVAAVAAVTAVALVAGATAALRNPGPSFIAPIVRPPHTFRLTDTLSSDPGRSLVAVLATKGEGRANGRSVYLQRATGGASVALTTTDRVQSAYYSTCPGTALG